MASKGAKVLPNLKMLDLSNVKGPGGSLLQFASSLPSLAILTLNFNIFNDSTTGITNSLHAFGASSSLKFLDMSESVIGGLSQQLIDGICRLTNLQELDMRWSEVRGILPACFSNLTALEHLDISYNQLSGDLAFSPLRALSSIRYLDLSDNKFRVPSSLAPFLNLTRLQHFDASDNEIYADMEFNHSVPTFQLKYLDISGQGLAGAFPKFLYHQRELEHVSLSNINFGGKPFPTWLLENNPKLEFIDLANTSLFGFFTLPAHPHQSLGGMDISNNRLNGSIPREIGAFFPMLGLINMSNNQHTGNIPSSIGDMKWLNSLDLSNNDISGGIPASIARGSSSLVSLILSNNNLQGEIFHELFNLPNLYELLLDGNNFSGRIPNCLSRCSYLISLDFSDNKLSGGIPSWIGSMIGLQKVIMPNNTLEGPIPEKLFNLPDLQILDLSTNLLSGTIPSNFNLPMINHIHLSKNKLQGRFPSTLCKSTSLITLDLSDNLFADGIPRCIGELQQLSYLILKNNSAKGRIPHEICKLTRLSVIDLSNNNFSGSIPPCLNITTLYEAPALLVPVNATGPTAATTEGIEFQTKSNSYTYKGRMLTFLSGIDLSCNKFTGTIPEEIGRLNKIYTLNLSHNSLTGGIPLTISNLKQVESLDLSFNNLQGGIPPHIVDLNFLSVFNLSFNNLSGPTPKRILQFATFEANSYEGNSLLCGQPLPKSCTVGSPFTYPNATSDEENDDGFMDMSMFYISLIASYVTSLLAVLLVLWINPYWRRKWFYYAEQTTTCCYYYVVDHLAKCF